ncbi:MAG: YkgJ family cysteine cluster protein [Archaeoglobus sp.]|nr:YkgJ family cysteine cluster protein [Archaeoglobus sp.]
MIEIMQADLVPWKRVKRWNCIRCGKCCEVLEVPVTHEEEKRLKKYGDVFIKSKIGVYLRKDRHCIFYTGKCRIYPERPIACRKYPFYIRYEGESSAFFRFGDEEYYVYLDKNCSGIGMGFRIEKVIENLIAELKNVKY